MEKRDYYTLKEVLFGLRREYMDTQRKLDSLKKCVATDDKSVEDMRFWVYKNEKRKAELECLFIEKKKGFAKLFDKSVDESELYFLGLNSTQCLKNNNDDYFIIDSKHNAYVKGDYNKEFSEEASHILNSEFANNMQGHNILGGTEKIGGTLEISPSMINVCVDGSFKLKSGVSNFSGNIAYFPISDDIQIIPGSDNFSAYKLRKCFDIQFDKNVFNDYQRQAIEYDAFKDKSLSCNVDLKRDDTSTLKISEGAKQYVLKRK